MRDGECPGCAVEFTDPKKSKKKYCDHPNCFVHGQKMKEFKERHDKWILAGRKNDEEPNKPRKPTGGMYCLNCKKSYCMKAPAKDFETISVPQFDESGRRVGEEEIKKSCYLDMHLKGLEAGVRQHEAKIDKALSDAP